MHETKTVLLIKGASQYNAMRDYLDEIADGFQQIGYQSVVIDAEHDFFLQEYKMATETFHIDYVFTCNANFYQECRDLGNARYVTYLCDHPAQHRDRLKKLDEDAVVFVCDLLHIPYIRKYYPNIKRVCFIPTSGSYSKTYIPYKDRKYDVVFTGSYYEPKELYEKIIEQYQGVLKQFVQQMIQEMEEQSWLTIEQCLEVVLNENHIQVSDEEFDELVAEFWRVSYYARFYYRDKVIHTLTKNGIKIHVFGNGWGDFVGNDAANLIWEKGDYLAAREAVANAYISLNTQPWFKGGFQERIASAMLSGTVAVTDDSLYIDENFTDQELCTYSLEKLEELPELIKSLLEDKEWAEKIAEKGRRRAQEELSWQGLTKDMAQYLEN